MENDIDASAFSHSGEVYFNEFENILTGISICYNKLLEDKKQVPLNDENGIRDILLLDYLKNNTVKDELNISNYLFDRETSEDISSGRVDLRVMPINPFISDDAYYILECKRIDNKARRGTSGLNYKYIKNGVARFTTDFYSNHYNTNAMIGFVVEKVDIDGNIEDINFLLENNFKEIDISSAIVKENFIKDFEFQYSSKHKSKSKKVIKLYHLMFDFAK